MSITGTPGGAAHSRRSSSGFEAEHFDLELVHRDGDSGLEEMAKEELQKPSPIRMWAVTKALELGMSVEEQLRASEPTTTSPALKLSGATATNCEGYAGGKVKAGPPQRTTSGAVSWSRSSSSRTSRLEPNGGAWPEAWRPSAASR